MLIAYFAEQLPIYEKQELAMSGYYKDMVQSIDVVKEEARLANVVFWIRRTRPLCATVPGRGASSPPHLDRRREDIERRAERLTTRMIWIRRRSCFWRCCSKPI